MRADVVVVYLFLFLLVIPAIGFYLYFMNLIFQHELTNDAIRIRLMGLVTLREIALKDIASIEVVSLLNPPDPTVMFYAERWPGKAVGKEGVLIRKRSGMSRVVLMTPESPHEFVQAVHRVQTEKRAREMA